MSFNFENERSAEAVETGIVSSAITGLSTVGGGGKEGAIENFNFVKGLREYSKIFIKIFLMSLNEFLKTFEKI